MILANTTVGSSRRPPGLIAKHRQGAGAWPALHASRRRVHARRCAVRRSPAQGHGARTQRVQTFRCSCVESVSSLCAGITALLRIARRARVTRLHAARSAPVRIGRNAAAARLSRSPTLQRGPWLGNRCQTNLQRAACSATALATTLGLSLPTRKRSALVDSRRFKKARRFRRKRRDTTVAGARAPIAGLRTLVKIMLPASVLSDGRTKMRNPAFYADMTCST